MSLLRRVTRSAPPARSSCNNALEVCEQRDVKGLYTKARCGHVTGFTGLDDPYEPPANPDITLDTVSNAVEVNARTILRVLRARGFVEGAIGRPRST